MKLWESPMFFLPRCMIVFPTFRTIFKSISLQQWLKVKYKIKVAFLSCRKVLEFKVSTTLWTTFVLIMKPILLTVLLWKMQLWHVDTSGNKIGINFYCLVLLLSILSTFVTKRQIQALGNYNTKWRPSLMISTTAIILLLSIVQILNWLSNSGRIAQSL